MMPAASQRVLNTNRPTLSSSFWVTQNLSNHMDWQARIRDTVLVSRRDDTDRQNPNTAVMAAGGGGEVKTTEN
jgi:hypothetical protein